MEKQRKKQSKHDILCTLGILLAATALAFLIFSFDRDLLTNIALLYTLALMLIARYTSGYLYGILSSVFCVVFINCCFTYPFFAINFQLSGYPVIFLGMLAVTLATSAMTTRLKKQDEMIAERERRINEAEKERIRANLLRAVSHDLRTPLTSIIGASASYMENYKDLDPSEQFQLIQTINEDSHWLLNMVENLLSVTRIQEDGSRVTKELEIVEEVVSEAITRLEKRLPGASIRVTAPADILMVPMDPLLIEQVLINLLENALIHSGSQEPVELKITEEPSTVTFHIMDHGQGIEESSIPELLTGQTSRSSSSDTHRGMGIGLSICSTIIKAHGSCLHARNHTDGADFYFSLSKED